MGTEVEEARGEKRRGERKEEEKGLKGERREERLRARVGQWE